jgi:hypothetical protein
LTVKAEKARALVWDGERRILRCEKIRRKNLLGGGYPRPIIFFVQTVNHRGTLSSP